MSEKSEQVIDGVVIDTRNDSEFWWCRIKLSTPETKCIGTPE